MNEWNGTELNGVQIRILYAYFFVCFFVLSSLFDD